MVVIEAQTSGLPSIASTEVPVIAKVSDRAYFISLDQPINVWTDIIKEVIKKERVVDLKSIKAVGFDIKTESKKLEQKYIEYNGGNQMKKNYLSKDECRKIQINILKIIDKICADYGINYCICGGTLLGAIRHKGYIPWDDDIDIMLLREDYNKLIDILKNQNEYDWLDVLDLDIKGYYYPFAKAVDNTTIAKQDDNTANYGVWVDIFPYDDLPSERKTRERFIMKNYRKRSIVLSRTTDFNAKDNINFRLIKRLLYFYSKVLNMEHFVKKYNKFGQKYNNSNSEYVGCMFSPYKLRECFNKEWFKNVRKYKFENEEFCGPLKYNEYLTQLYGDYMELPPVEKRRDHKVIAWKK